MAFQSSGTGSTGRSWSQKQISRLDTWPAGGRRRGRMITWSLPELLPSGHPTAPPIGQTAPEVSPAAGAGQAMDPHPPNPGRRCPNKSGNWWILWPTDGFRCGGYRSSDRRNLGSQPGLNLYEFYWRRWSSCSPKAQISLACTRAAVQGGRGGLEEGGASPGKFFTSSATDGPRRKFNQTGSQTEP